MKVNVPNALSISRLILTPVLITLAIFDERIWFGWLLLGGVITDVLDGWVARNANQETEIGARLDSAGDASLFFAGVVGVCIFETDFFLDHFISISIAGGLYIIQLVYGFHKYGRSSSLHTYSAKLAAFFQGVFLVLTVFLGPYEWLYWITIIISILETIEEIIIIYLLDEWKSNVKGLYWVLNNNKQ